MERMRKAQDQKAGLKRANEDLIRMQEEVKQKEFAELKKIEAYAAKKEAMEKLKKDREEQKFQDKLAERQKLIDRQCYEHSQLKNRENEILNKQVAEAEEKAGRLFVEQERRRM